MSACEKCWGDAYLKSLRNGKTQGECYSKLLKERKTILVPIENRRDNFGMKRKNVIGEN